MVAAAVTATNNFLSRTYAQPKRSQPNTRRTRGSPQYRRESSLLSLTAVDSRPDVGQEERVHKYGALHSQTLKTRPDGALSGDIHQGKHSQKNIVLLLSPSYRRNQMLICHLAKPVHVIYRYACMLGQHGCLVPVG